MVYGPKRTKNQLNSNAVLCALYLWLCTVPKREVTFLWQSVKDCSDLASIFLYLLWITKKIIFTAD